MPRYSCIIEYEGTDYHGWQKQNDCPSIQQSLIEAIEKFCGQKVDVIASGRTDAGVHAIAQVAHFDLNKNHPIEKVMGAINFHLRPQPISVIDCKVVDENFHARFSANKRYYVYRIINRRAPLVLESNRAWHVAVPLNVSLMEDAAKVLIGRHDFSSFRDSHCQAKSPVRTLDNISINKSGDLVEINIDAQSFLHHMVRIIVGTLKLVGEGKWNKGDLVEALESKKREFAGPTAPACGLYFEKVDYD